LGINCFSDMSYPVFVYGTLKRKHINHLLLEGVGVARIRRARLFGVQLFDIADPMRPYPYPALLRGAGQVLGELVDLMQLEDGLLVLDHLECEGFEYHRVPCWVRVSGQLERAWVYVYASKRFLCRMKGKRHGLVSWSPQRHHLAKHSKTV
jgi:gamma-glutamylcyclotransferase (GGCT)/AIG2-like uncharacterized protein YtfP